MDSIDTLVVDYNRYNVSYENYPFRLKANTCNGAYVIYGHRMSDWQKLNTWLCLITLFICKTCRLYFDLDFILQKT